MGAQLEKTTFLLVEDDAQDVSLVRREFTRSDGSVNLQAVGDGIEAVRYLQGENDYADRERFPLPHVVLLDLKMPRFSGFDFLEWLHHKSPGDLRMLPVIVLSSSDQPADVNRAYALGANAYLVKPIDWRAFRERLRAIKLFWSAHTETPMVEEAELGWVEGLKG